MHLRSSVDGRDKMVGFHALHDARAATHTQFRELLIFLSLLMLDPWMKRLSWLI
jgi:hypothetical protein